MKKDVLIWSLLVGLILSGLYSCKSSSAHNEAPTAVPAEVVTIGAADANTQNDYTASLEGKVNVEIRSQVDGYLEKVYVDEGAYVKAGQPLFKIDDHRYREQLNNAKASLHAAEAAVLNAQLEVDKVTPLVANKVVSDIQLRTAKTAYEVATANVEQAKALVAAASINLGYTNITAPVSGYIGRIPKKAGALISLNDPEPLTKLSDVHEIYAYFSLSESDFFTFKDNYAGTTLEEKLRNLPPAELVLADNHIYEKKGKVDMIDGQFEKNTGAITLRAVFPNEKGTIRTGNTGKVRLQRQFKEALLVPQAATIEVQDRVFVYTVGKDNKITRQAITIIGTSGNQYLVKDGVKAGDVIVITGVDRLKEGTEIKPEKAKPVAKG
ncbi:efflux RND transporter periplasmic adaptor subunit [Chitinophaga filiformis]|uniref:Efflux RND transporter periplasmic adaptor subunit n=1 Tax=Chitinophaga filiformis TaxID=104663 RepID=A0ABY4HUM6_CHIFI|nr:efflux RND transporter periplasmic adaptor subunit [Chitinophaga filiformis]UPK67227.1 efflux RND transporter periplasmic adaptor subunit [Chitinophaga filiformis]